MIHIDNFQGDIIEKSSKTRSVGTRGENRIIQAIEIVVKIEVNVLRILASDK